MPSAAYRHHDTHTMPYEELPENPVARRQLLWRDEATGACVQMSYGPPGFPPNVVKVLQAGPHRHFHNTVNERHYVLAGDYPVWHWANLDDAGTRTVLRRHTYLENRPHTLHGVRPETVPAVATQMLVWNNGGGTSIFDKDAARETIDVPFDGSVRPNQAWRGPVLAQLDERAWAPHPLVPGWKLKPVAAAADGMPAVAQVSVPPDFAFSDAAPKIDGGARRWLFLLSGDLAVQIASGAKTESVMLREGHFLSWEEGARLTFGERAITGGGCVALCTGTDLAQPVA